jgi:hypothetical protein
VEAYSRQFQALLARCTDLAPRTVIDLYTGGLGQPLAHDVEMQYPIDLQKAMSLVRAFEQRHAESSAVNSSMTPKGSGHRAIASAYSTSAPGGPPPEG